MKNKPSTSPLKLIRNTIRKFSITLFIVAISGGLIASVLILSNVLTPHPSNSSTSNSGTTTTFDQATIDRLDKLTTSNDSSGNQVLPSDRINPFSG